MKKLLLTSAGFENPKIGKLFLELINKSASETKIILFPLPLLQKKIWIR